MNKVERYIVLIWAFVMVAIDYFHLHEYTDFVVLVLAIITTGVIYYLIGFIILSLANAVVGLISKLNLNKEKR